MGEFARAFVALWPPEEIVVRLEGLHRKDQRGVRFVRPENWHVTLRFLFWDTYVSLVVILLASFAVGVLLGFAFGRVRLRRRRRLPDRQAVPAEQGEKPSTPGLS